MLLLAALIGTLVSGGGLVPRVDAITQFQGNHGGRQHATSSQSGNAVLFGGWRDNTEAATTADRARFRSQLGMPAEEEGFGPRPWWSMDKHEDILRRRRVDDVAADDDGSNELCSEYLVSFLQGTTDAKDDCEGIMNAYLAASCGAASAVEADDDDYIPTNSFNNMDCCETLRTHYFQYCEESDMMSAANLLLITGVLLLCEFAKTVVRKRDLKFLPEAAVCILVGTFCGIISLFVYEGFSMDEATFDAELFLNILLPPIIFEAALSVNKREFKRRRFPIFMFAIFGTILSTFITGLMVYYTTLAARGEDGLPMLDSLVFGALISSVDPVAILSVLTSLGMTETDTIFILVFGESLLNDGVAITMFNALVGKYMGGADSAGTTQDEILGAVADFLIVGFGSLSIGLAAGFLSLVYFYVLHGFLPPVVEVASFFLWALVPYYICDIIGWSGIVGIVMMGFFMDVFIAAPKKNPAPENWSDTVGGGDNDTSGYVRFEDEPIPKPASRAAMRRRYGSIHKSMRSVYLSTFEGLRPLFGSERVRLSENADKHVRFVAHLLAQVAENSIFVYLGLFLFSNKYDWDAAYIAIGVVSCVLARAVMVVLVSWFVWHIHILRQRFWYSDAENGQDPGACNYESACGGNPNIRISRSISCLREKRTQLVLVLAGLRGAISLALVENVPIYNGVTGEGSMYKPTLKAMTSVSIIFTTFVFGGGAYYILRILGIQSNGEGGDLDTPNARAQELTSRVGSSSGTPSSLEGGQNASQMLSSPGLT